MRQSPFVVLLLCVALASGGCTWVKLEPQARQVRVASADVDLSGCERRGEVAVAVKDGVGPVARNPLKVRDELETLARNEALGLNADTVQPKSEPANGQQRYLAFRCGAAPVTGRRVPVDTTEDDEDDGVEVFRID